MNKKFVIISLLAVIIVSFIAIGGQMKQKKETQMETKGSIKPTNIKQIAAIDIFLKDNATKSQVSLLQEELKAMTGVYRVDYISQDQAFNMYREQNKNDSILKELAEKEIFPESFQVYISDQQQKDIIMKNIKKKEIVKVAIFSRP